MSVTGGGDLRPGPGLSGHPPEPFGAPAGDVGRAATE